MVIENVYSQGPAQRIRFKMNLDTKCTGNPMAVAFFACDFVVTAGPSYQPSCTTDGFPNLVGFTLPKTNSE